jgi:hypothetical protein
MSLILDNSGTARRHTVVSSLALPVFRLFRTRLAGLMSKLACGSEYPVRNVLAISSARLTWISSANEDT